MVGRSGISEERRESPMASTRSLPDFTCGMAEIAAAMDICIWPAIRSASIGGEPLYGMCWAWMPVIALNSSVGRAVAFELDP
jgi:hypothetical protein